MGVKVRCGICDPGDVRCGKCSHGVEHEPTSFCKSSYCVHRDKLGAVCAPVWNGNGTRFVPPPTFVPAPLPKLGEIGWKPPKDPIVCPLNEYVTLQSEELQRQIRESVPMMAKAFPGTNGSGKKQRVLVRKSAVTGETVTFISRPCDVETGRCDYCGAQAFCTEFFGDRGKDCEIFRDRQVWLRVMATVDNSFPLCGSTDAKEFPPPPLSAVDRVNDLRLNKVLDPHYEHGKHCKVAGVTADRMTRQQLIAFVGMVDAYGDMLAKRGARS